MVPSRLILAALAMATLFSSGALGRDERSGEWMTGDDDPILLPLWVAEPEASPTTAEWEPETTGSIVSDQRIGQRRCDRVAWFPEKPADKQLREAC